MYYVYNVLVYLAAPVAILVQVWRGLRDPSYRERLGERFGLGPPIPGSTIWIHAVSVGEVQAAQPLIAQFQKRHPHYGILLTTVTPTGAARARLLFGDRVHLRYVPLDLPGSVRRFFDRVQPKLAMILETELWPNLYGECGRRGVPLVLASARISPRSVGKYRRMVSLFRKTLSHGIVIPCASVRSARLPSGLTSPATSSSISSLPRASRPRAGAGARSTRPDGRSGWPGARTTARRPSSSTPIAACLSVSRTRCWCWCRDTRSVSTACGTC
jgi:3-deoxy-D-manno-octulosonic-acid transferase